MATTESAPTRDVDWAYFALKARESNILSEDETRRLIESSAKGICPALFARGSTTPAS